MSIVGSLVDRAIRLCRSRGRPAERQEQALRFAMIGRSGGETEAGERGDRAPRNTAKALQALSFGVDGVSVIGPLTIVTGTVHGTSSGSNLAQLWLGLTDDLSTVYAAQSLTITDEDSHWRFLASFIPPIPPEVQEITVRFMVGGESLSVVQRAWS